MPLVNLNVQEIRNLLQQLDFSSLFNQLGWSSPSNPKSITASVQDTEYTRTEIAELAGVVILEIETPGGKIPDAKLCKAIHKEVSAIYHENLLIFLDNATTRTQSFWYLMKRDGKKEEPRTHLYVKGQPGDLSLSKLESIVFDIAYFEEKGTPSVLDVARSLEKALDVQRVTKLFYESYKAVHEHFEKYIIGIDDEKDKQQYASLLLNRLMFVYFLQCRRFIDGGRVEYLQEKLAESRSDGPDLYYKRFLKALFFQGFAKLEAERDEETKRLIGSIRYLNGGLFLPHRIEQKWSNIRIADEAFDRLLKLFSDYTWNLDDTPGGKDDEISPHVLGYIFEKYINQKSFGAYYTRPQITEYLCEHTIHTLLLEKINVSTSSGIMKSRHFETIEELLINLDARLCRELLDILPTISILDPACGSGAFLVSAMNTLTTIYGAITGRINVLNDAYLKNWLNAAYTQHKSLTYYIKRKIITENLFGVDIMEEATEIARLRLFLALVASVQIVEELEPLPNIDFNILPGNSLIGLLHVNEQRLAQMNSLC